MFRANECQRSEMVEASSANKLQILELLLYEHLDPNTTDAYGRTLLELAAGGDQSGGRQSFIGGWC